MKNWREANVSSLEGVCVQSGVDYWERTTPLYSCHGVFIDQFISSFKRNCRWESETKDLFLDQISLKEDSRGSAMTNHKKLVDVTASLIRNSPVSQNINKINHS